MIKCAGLSVLLSGLIITLFAKESHEQILIQRLDAYTRGKLDRALIAGLETRVNSQTFTLTLPLPQQSIHPLLFEHYPILKTKIAHVSLCNLPTPVLDCKIAQKIGVENIYIKHDGKTGTRVGSENDFGGNKPRILEFLLADAIMHGHDAILAGGGTGTNFGLAAAIYARKLGLESTLVLMEQPNSYTVQRNLLLMLESGASLRVAPNAMCFYTTLAMEFLHHKQETGKFPYLFPTGGSHPLGALGFVNAIFELDKQIKEGILEEPDYIYAAVGNGTGGKPGSGTGTGGTVTGLLLGLRLTGLKSCLVAVHVEPEVVPEEVLIDVKKMFHDTNLLLNTADPSIPLYEFPRDKFIEIKEFCGEDYGFFTKGAMEVRALLFETDSIKLDGTYTAKAFEAMLHMIKAQSLYKKKHLFWNGYCADEFNDKVSRVNYKNAPHVLHHYFENPVQQHDSKL